MRMFLIVLAALVLAAPCMADGDRVVRNAFFKADNADHSGVDLDTVGTLSLAAGGATTYTLALPAYQSEVQSVDYLVVADDAAASIVLTLQRKTKYGTWQDTDEVITLTGATSYDDCEAISVPVSSDFRFKIEPDGSHAAEVQALVLNKF